MKNTMIVVFVILVCFLTKGAYSQVIAQSTFEPGDDKVTIYYQFSGDDESEYKISVKVKRKGDIRFEVIPSVMIGDYPKGKFANQRRTIIWQATTSEQENLSKYDDFYFEVSAAQIEKTIVEKESKSTWYYYVIGAVVLGGGAAVFLKPKDTGSSTTPAGSSLAIPPGRPGN